MTDDAADLLLVRQMLGMKESDLFILRGALQQESPPRRTGFGRKKQEVHLATQEGSANHHLWRKLEGRGLLSAQEVAGLTDVHGTKIYALLPQGRDPIARLLAQRDQMLSDHVSAMARINNEKSLPFARDFVSSIEAGGGDIRDVATLTSLLLKVIVQGSVPETQRAKLFDAIMLNARKLLARDTADRRVDQPSLTKPDGETS